MIEIIILTTTVLIFIAVLFLITRSIIIKQPIFGKPTIYPAFFVLAKLSAFCNIFFLLLRGLKVHLNLLFTPPPVIEYLAMLLLITGTIIAILASSVLKSDLLFGLPKKEQHHLRTGGIYKISRHPFYLGFIFILISSVLMVPNIINILLFLNAWVSHHFIMIKEEEFLLGCYGEEYKAYKSKVRRYITLY